MYVSILFNCQWIKVALNTFVSVLIVALPELRRKPGNLLRRSNSGDRVCHLVYTVSGIALRRNETAFKANKYIVSNFHTLKLLTCMIDIIRADGLRPYVIDCAADTEVLRSTTASGWVCKSHYLCVAASPLHTDASSRQFVPEQTAVFVVDIFSRKSVESHIVFDVLFRVWTN